MNAVSHTKDREPATDNGLVLPSQTGEGEGGEGVGLVVVVVVGVGVAVVVRTMPVLIA